MTLHVHIYKKLEHFPLDIALSCPSGTLTAIVGPSGAGKSTLIRIISGLERADSGTISLGNSLWYNSSQKLHLPPQHRRLSMVFQEYTLFPHLTVRQNIAFAAVNNECIDQLMEQFGICQIADRKPARISGGERQRVAFCQALAREPVVLLLDEPFSALDIATRKSLRHTLKNLKHRLHIPIIHITHDLEEAYELADDIYVMEQGRASPQWLEKHSPHTVPSLSLTF